MKASTTYRRGRAKSAMNTMAEKSTDLADYRAKLIYLNIRRKHPRLDPSIVKAIASNRALFVTIFQAPLEFFGKLRIKIWLLFQKRKIKKKPHDIDKSGSRGSNGTNRGDSKKTKKSKA